MRNTFFIIANIWAAGSILENNINYKLIMAVLCFFCLLIYVNYDIFKKYGWVM